MLVIFATGFINLDKMNKKCILLLVLLMLVTFGSYAQDRPDSTFIGKIYNDELKVYIVMNLVDKNVTVPQQDIFGNVDGYMGCTGTEHVWTIVTSEVKGHTAHIEMINNYGSEDVSATLTHEKDGSYTYKHLSGSTLKFPVGQKWHKIPSKVVFKKK